MLAAFIGFEVIRRVSPLLHTPLMSLTNALDAIAVVGAIVLVGEHKSTLSTVLGSIAVVAATSNVVGGFMPTVISLLNSYAGLSAAAMGFVLNSKLLIIAGALDGSSGLILSIIMSKAMATRSTASIR